MTLPPLVYKHSLADAVSSEHHLSDLRPSTEDCQVQSLGFLISLCLQPRYFHQNQYFSLPTNPCNYVSEIVWAALPSYICSFPLLLPPLLEGL